MKDTFKRKSTKTLILTDYWVFYASLLGKIHIFMDTVTYKIRKKVPEI